MGKSVKRQAYHLPGGHKKLISTKSVTVAEEIVQELCLEMNIRGTAEQHEFCLCYILEKNGSIKILNNDEYIMDVTTELDVANEEYVLLLTRSVWISPLRADSPLYIDVLFFQTVPNYVAGFLNILPKEQLTAALLDDTAIFGALLLLSDPYNRDEILTSEIVQNLIPKSILKRSTITLEQWVGRVENKTRLLPHNIDHMEARRMFLEKLEKWPLFGASFFFVKRVNAEKVQLLEAIVAINKHGIRVLTSDTHEAVLHHTLNEIETTNQYKTSTGNYIDIRLNPNKDNREVISLETENGGEIARVVAHYTYLIKEKDSFYALDRAIASSEL
uniref:FERM domain-containing protein n=1 Tax=Acrobeloides nanus TaxID=290746 RepID=A0A914D141_9BILA